MNKLRVVLLILAALVMVAAPAFAANAEAPAAAGATPAAATPSVEAVPATSVQVLYGSAIGAGLIILGAGYGIGRIGAQAVEGMARQPEVAGNIQTAMIIAAALIEGATFFALIVTLAK